MEQQNPYVEMVFTFVQQDRNVIRSLDHCAHNVLTPLEYTLVEEEFGDGTTPMPDITSRTHTPEQEAIFKKLATYFKKNTEKVTLSEIVGWSKKMDQRADLLKRDLLLFRNQVWGEKLPKGGSRGNTALQNAWKLIGTIYGAPLVEVTNRIEEKSQEMIRVMDLYFITEKEIEHMAYRRKCYAGEKTFEALNQTLRLNNLPKINDVYRH